MKDIKELANKFQIIWIITFGLYVLNNLATEWFPKLIALRPALLGLAMVGIGFGLSSVMIRRGIK